MGKKSIRQAERIAAAKARDNAKSDRIIAAAADEPLSAAERARLLAQRSRSRRSGQLAMALALISSVAL
jgi:hypothetical protein